MNSNIACPLELRQIISDAQLALKASLRKVMEKGSLPKDSYVRLLTYQYHLTNGVQRHFMIAASHPDLAHRKTLRTFLFNFALEEELHYEIALKDLRNLGEEPLPCPLDVKLWWAYFDSVVYDRPFLRLGATCILENIAGQAGEELSHLLKSASYLTPRTTRFIEIHKHDESLPHGDQILEAMVQAELTEAQWQDLYLGAREASIMYMRLIHWAFGT